MYHGNVFEARLVIQLGGRGEAVTGCSITKYEWEQTPKNKRPYFIVERLREAVKLLAEQLPEEDTR